MQSEKMETKAGESDAHSLSSASTGTPNQVHQNNPDNDLERALTEKSHHAGQENVNKVMTALDWTGPDDPENPENWSSAKKVFHTTNAGLQCFVVYVSFCQIQCASLTTFDQNFRILCLQPCSIRGSASIWRQYNGCTPASDTVRPWPGFRSYAVRTN